MSIIVLGSAISFDSLLTTIHVLPTTKPGSIVANLTLLIDEAALNSSYYMEIYKYNNGRVYHNDSGWIGPHLLYNINPLFELISSTPDVVVSDGNRLIFKNSAIQHLRMAPPAKCVTDSTRYVAVSFGLRLLSDSLYHLGDHLIIIKVSFCTRTKSYFFHQYVRLTVEAGKDCDKGLLFKFNYVAMTYILHYLSVLLFQSVQTVRSCITLLSIAVCLLAHVGTLHSDHTQLHTVKQVCLLCMG